MNPLRIWLVEEVGDGVFRFSVKGCQLPSHELYLIVGY
jgi:hypothetical protein